jgi:competence ComEA-like helix-hairpin-helix protein
MSSLKKIVRDYFTFSKTERNAVVALLILILLAAFLPLIFRLFNKPETSEKYTMLKQQLNEYASENDKEFTLDYASLSVVEKEAENELFYFNPNTATKEEWMQLGMPENVANTATKYVSKGGKFRDKTDLLKIYGFTQAHLDRLYPYIQIDFDKQNYYAKTDKPDANIFTFDPNEISIEEWMQLGVDEKLASRIIKYRSTGAAFYEPDDLLKIYGFKQYDFERLKNYMIFNTDTSGTQSYASNDIETLATPKTNDRIELNSASKDDLIFAGFSSRTAYRILDFRENNGGFYAEDQLNDIFQISEEEIQSALPNLQVDASKVQKLNLNTATVEQLARHNYISDKTAQSIIDYRNAHGRFISIAELRKVQGMYASTFEKLKPYLEL